MEELFKRVDYYCKEFIKKDNFITIKTDNLSSLSSFIFYDLDCDLCNAFAVENRIIYLYSYKKSDHFFILEQEVKDDTFESFADKIPALNWFEREIYDLWGFKPLNHPDLRSLSLHPEVYPKGFHPFKNDINEVEKIYEEYETKDIKDEGVYTVLVGPIHAGIIEPGHFRFSMSGEPILQLEVRHFYKHRGIEKLSIGKTVEEVLKISERISGDNAVAYAIAYAMAIEKISQVSIPKSAKYSRVIASEIERISCLLSDVSGIFQDVGYSFGAAGISALKEEIMRIMKILSGNRFFKDFIIIGGVSKNIAINTKEILKLLSKIEKKFDKYVKILHNSASILERLETTGRIKKDTIKELSCVGFTARASGRESDFRKEHPYLIYDRIDFESITQKEGDVYSRTKVKISDIKNSFYILKVCFDYLSQIKSPKLKTNVDIKDGEAFGYAESSRGNISLYLKIKDKKVIRFKPRDPSFLNWQSIQFAVLGNVIGDFPLVNKSLNLSYAGNDL